MRIVVVGMGVQGKKRLSSLGNNLVGIVDSVASSANYRNIRDIPLSEFDCALLAVPDDAKPELIRYLVEYGKHIIVEKPLVLTSDSDWAEIQDKLLENKLVLYTAYNHRFEPNVGILKSSLQDGLIGSVYYCKIFYGNGTAKLVKESVWRDKGMGVLLDIGSHLLDLVDYWFGRSSIENIKGELNSYENEAPDHASVLFKLGKIQFHLEMSLCSWKNTFSCDLFGSNGSLHIDGLTKWSSSTFTHRRRVFPSGIPQEIVHIEPKGDPTWDIEIEYFKNLLKGPELTNLSKDKWIYDSLRSIFESARIS